MRIVQDQVSIRTAVRGRSSGSITRRTSLVRFVAAIPFAMASLYLATLVCRYFVVGDCSLVHGVLVPSLDAQAVLCDGTHAVESDLDRPCIGNGGDCLRNSQLFVAH